MSVWIKGYIIIKRMGTNGSTTAALDLSSAVLPVGHSYTPAPSTRDTRPTVFNETIETRVLYYYYYITFYGPTYTSQYQ